jgi:hypothetical protein
MFILLFYRWCTKPKRDEPQQKPSYLPPPQPVYSPQPPPTSAPKQYSINRPVSPAPPQPIYSSQPQPSYITSSSNQVPTASPAYYKPLPNNKRKRTAIRQAAPGRPGYGTRKSKLLTSDPHNSVRIG